MKNFYKLLSIITIFAIITIHASAEEYSSAAKKNEYLCNGKTVVLDGCYYDSNSSEDKAAYGDIVNGNYKPIITYVEVANNDRPKPAVVKSAKFMQAYNIINRDEKVVLGLCYTGYIGSTGEKLTDLDEVVSSKDSNHPYRVTYLRVLVPDKNNKCSDYNSALVMSENDFHMLYPKKSMSGSYMYDLASPIETTGYEGYSKGSCPALFNHTSSLKSIALFFNSSKEYTFTDNAEAQKFKPSFFDNIIMTDYSGRITGCTKADDEGEEFSTECYDKVINKVQNYTCPSKLTDIDMNLGDYEKNCDPLLKMDKQSYAREYAEKLAKENIQIIKSEINKKISECYEYSLGTVCKLTESEKKSVISKMKSGGCYDYCDIGTKPENMDPSGKCYSNAGSSGGMLKWALEKPDGAAWHETTLAGIDDCYGNTKQLGCRNCYKKSSDGLSEEKAGCISDLNSSKDSVTKEKDEEVEEKIEGQVEKDMEEGEELRQKIWDDSFTYKTFQLPGLSDADFGPDDQTCKEILKDNLISIIKSFINIIRIAGVIIAIGNGMITLIPAVISKDADGLKKAEKKLVTMAIVLAAIGIFPTFVSIIGGIFGFDLTCIFPV